MMGASLLQRMDPSGRLGRWLDHAVPQALFLPGLFLPSPVVLRVDQLPLTEKGRLALGDLARKADEIAVMVESGAALVRTVRLPKAAAGMADEAVRLQMRQTLPDQAQGLLWQRSNGTVEGDHLVFQVHILRAEDVTALRKLAEAGGAKVVSVQVAGAGDGSVWRADEGRVRRARTVAAAAVLAVLLVALVPVWMLAVERQALADANAAKVATVAALQKRLDEMTATASEAELRQQEKADVIAQFRRQQQRLAMLGDLARALPASVWLSELSVSGDEMRLSGFSADDPTVALRALQGMAWAETARMDGPIMFDSLTRENRFNVWIGLKGRAE
jgi:Tfp pilus assembly protein PilN